MLTTNRIYEWCGGHIRKPRIKKILEQEYEHISINRWSYFKVQGDQ